MLLEMHIEYRLIQYINLYMHIEIHTVEINRTITYVYIMI